MSAKSNFSKRILVGITSNFDGSWRDKIREINEFKIEEAALFLEQVTTKKERQEIYAELEKSTIKNILLVHIRNNMDKDELAFLCQRYNNPCLTIHEDSFKYLDKWRGFHKNLFLELNYDNHLTRQVEVDKIGGFCVDLSHFKAGEEKWSKEFLYVLSQKSKKDHFICNHVNGYSYKENHDMHTISDLKQFDYLKTLPGFLFGKIIAIETYNTIKEQLKFKECLIKLLN
ncbi:MAG: hypothetical protein WCX17_04370 [Parcubacteria group bacterium]|jgi:hypothetical protein